MINSFSSVTSRSNQNHPVKLPSIEQKNPWLAMAGVFKDDPQFEQILEAIEKYRRELDQATKDSLLQD